MKVNVVTEKGSWILKRIAEESVKLISKGYVVREPDPSADINYYVNYALFQDVPTIKVSYFTHHEAKFERSWKLAEQNSDACIYVADMYKPNNPNCYKIFPAGLEYPVDKELKVGVAGRIYEDGRKGEQDIKRLMLIPGIKWFSLGDDSWKVLGNKINISVWRSDRQAIRWYRNLDVLICMSKKEGGPVPILEAIKCGVPNIVSTRVGNFEEWNGYHGTHIVQDVVEARNILLMLKEQHDFRYKLSQKTWDWLAREHLSLFKALVNK